MEWQGEGPIGSRPPMVRDNRHDSVHLLGAICPARATRAAIVMPAVNTEAIVEHLREISATVAPGAHALVVCDRAGWHQIGKRLHLHGNISLLHLPPYAPGLNPMEIVWAYLRSNKLANLVWDSYDAILAAMRRGLEVLHNRPSPHPHHRTPQMDIGQWLAGLVLIAARHDLVYTPEILR